MITRPGLRLDDFAFSIDARPTRLGTIESGTCEAQHLLTGSIDDFVIAHQA
jgi:hypothetical protein